MFKADDRIAVAVSGGKDSVSLLHILDKIEKNFPESELIAITVDEGILDYRSEAVRIAKKNCQKLHIEHRIVSFRELYGHELDEIVKTVKKGRDLSPCSYCGVLRRRALEVIARELGADKVATAHNLDDNVQTMLLNIIHGDVTRIARVSPVLNSTSLGFVKRVKPICEILEREIALYSYLKKIGFQTHPCPYAGTALRNEVRNTLNRMEVKHPGTKFTIFRAFEKIRSAMKGTMLPIKLQKCDMCGETTVDEICKPCQILLNLDPT